MKRDEVRKVAREAFDQLVRDIEAGKSDTLRAYLKAMGRFHRYSMGNAILIQLQKADATHVAGFRAWQRLGRYVKKGEHGIAVMTPVVCRRKARSDDGDAAKDKDEDEAVSTFKTAYVFDISQTDGKPLPEFGVHKGIRGYTWRSWGRSSQTEASSSNGMKAFGWLKVCQSAEPSY